MFEKLIRLVRKAKVSLFIGAGFSIEANAPSVSKLKVLSLQNLIITSKGKHMKAMIWLN